MQENEKVEVPNTRGGKGNPATFLVGKPEDIRSSGKS
jgi:hypothetical protein